MTPNGVLKMPVTQIEEYIDNGRAVFKVIKISTEKTGFSFQTGQFVMVTLENYTRWDKPEELWWTAMSISSSHLEKGYIEFCMEIKETPGFSKYVGDHLKVGDSMLVRGPLGKFLIKDTGTDMIFVATGSGIAPIMGMIRTLVKNNYKKPFKLFFGFKTRNDFIYRKELEGYAKKMKNFEIIAMTSRDPEWGGLTGHVQNQLKEHGFDNQEKIQAYICGNPKMVMEVKELLKGLGFKPENLFQEQWV